jgi:phosphoserine phosphatase
MTRREFVQLTQSLIFISGKKLKRANYVVTATIKAFCSQLYPRVQRCWARSCPSFTIPGIIQGKLETMLVLDADKTLAAEDAGMLFWQRVSSSQLPGDEDCPLKTLFSNPLGYSYKAFRQATLLYEESTDDAEFDAICEDVASAVTMYPEFVSLLRLVKEQGHVGAVVVTCGLRRVWEKVLDKEGLSKTVKVIGGGRISDGLVVTAVLKAALVIRLHGTHKAYVWAFGDSVLDLGMLGNAD